MVLNAFISVVYGTVVESWALAVLTAKLFVPAVIGYAWYRDLDITEFVLDTSEYFVAALIIAGFLLSRSSVAAPSAGVFSQIVALVYFFFLFWNY